MIDLPSLSDGLALFKSGMDGIRSALSVYKDIRGSIPENAKAEFDLAIEHSEKQLQIAEAQIAKGLGYQLCHCQFPPTPMLTIGRRNGRGNAATTGPVHQCPKCKLTDNGGFAFTLSKAFQGQAAEIPGAVEHPEQRSNEPGLPTLQRTP